MSLRISTHVTRCPDAATGKMRVRLGKKCVTVEDLVLHRWRRRSTSASDGERFDGCRLRPNTWRAVRLACDGGLSLTEPLTIEALAAAIAQVQASNPTLRATQSGRLLRVMSYLRSRGVLDAVVYRDRSETNPGLPDLFLWRENRSGTIRGGRFVEVKTQTSRPKRREQLSAGQKSELAFLRSIGLKAKAIWLTVAPARPSPAADCKAQTVKLGAQE